MKFSSSVPEQAHITQGNSQNCSKYLLKQGDKGI